MTFEQAKNLAYGTALDVFFSTMRRLVGEAGIARLAGSEPDEHITIVSTGDGRAFMVQIAIKFGPLAPAPGLDEIIDAPPGA